MASRRDFIKKVLAASAGMALLGDRLSYEAGSASSATGKKESPGGNGRSMLKDMNPRDVDVKGLEITPLKDFGTMGLDDQEIDLNLWRLAVDGSIRKPMNLTYAEVQAAPSVERAVLLICPGVFANYGLWRGISLSSLLKKAGMLSEANFVTFRGPEGRYEKVMRVPVEDALSEKVFLAYSVNGSPLPVKHGFPLRLVAEGYYGYDWVKYVHRVSAEAIKT
jgi:DMSO/TMAO reductase YedYZ molybdopterin-dependent catalytic subunit